MKLDVGLPGSKQAVRVRGRLRLVVHAYGAAAAPVAEMREHGGLAQQAWRGVITGRLSCPECDAVRDWTVRRCVGSHDDPQGPSLAPTVICSPSRAHAPL